MIDEKIIQKCRENDRKAQKHVFEELSPKMLAVARRYFKNLPEAEDIMVQGFFKAFSKLNQYGGKGSFEGWLRRIVVNEALMEIRKKKIFSDSIEDHQHYLTETQSPDESLIIGDIYKLLDKLPDGYRTIFNMYVIEGYKHREIAEKLDISINTSKSQLIQAKKKLRSFISELKYFE